MLTKKQKLQILATAAEKIDSERCCGRGVFSCIEIKRAATEIGLKYDDSKVLSFLMDYAEMFSPSGDRLSFSAWFSERYREEEKENNIRIIALLFMVEMIGNP